MAIPRFLLVALWAAALSPARAESQQAPEPRALVAFPGDTIKDMRPSPNGRFVLLATAVKLRMYELASRQSWDLATCDCQMMSWSAGGDRIVWGRGQTPSTMQVWSMAIDPGTGRPRGSAQRVTTGPAAMPSISPDGRWIAHIGLDTLSRTMNVSVLPTTGGPSRVIANKIITEGGFVWSADGKSVYVDLAEADSALRPGTSANNWGLTKVAVDGSRRERLKSPPGEYLVGATADRRYLFTTSTSLRRVVRPGESVTIIDTTGHVVGRVPLPSGYVLRDAPTVIGDSALVLSSLRPGPSLLEVKPLDGGRARRLPVAGTSNTHPVWSPDGRRIAFMVASNGRTALGVMNADGSNAVVHDSVDVFVGGWALRWSRDSRHVAFRNTSATRLLVLDVTSGTVRTVVDEPGRQWTIGGWGWRSDGRALFYQTRVAGSWNQYEITLQGQRRVVLSQAPLASKLAIDAVAWNYFADTALLTHVVGDTVITIHPFGPGHDTRFGTVPPGSGMDFTEVSHDGRLAVSSLLRRDGRSTHTNQLVVVSMTDRSIRTINLPFSWQTGSRQQFSFTPDDSAVFVFGRATGASGVKLYRVPLYGGEPSEIADISTGPVPGVSFSATTSPDGRSVVYGVQPSPPTQSLLMIDLRPYLPRQSGAGPGR